MAEHEQPKIYDSEIEPEFGSQEPSGKKDRAKRGASQSKEGRQHIESAQWQSVKSNELAQQEEARLTAFIQQQGINTEEAVVIAAAKTRRVLTITIAAVHTDAKGAYWAAYIGNCEVRIYCKDTFESFPNGMIPDHDPTTREIERQKQFLSANLGAEIQCIIYDTVSEEGLFLCFASRVRALRVMRRYYLNPASPLALAPDTVANARILAVGDHSLYVTLGGVDMQLRNNAITHRFLRSLQEAYGVGDTLPVYIREINFEDGQYAIRVSGRLAELETLRPNLSRITTGSRYKGVVTTIRKANVQDNIPRVIVSLYLEDIHVAAFATMIHGNIGCLSSGDKVIFQANGTTSDGYAHGSIVRLVSHNKL